MQLHVSPDTCVGQWRRPRGPTERDERGGAGHHDDAGHVRQLRRQDHRTEAVPETDDHHQSDPRDRPTAQVESDEKRHADGADAESQVATSRDVFVGASYARDQDGEEGNAADQQAGERTRDVLFGRRHAVPGDPEFDDGEDDDPTRVRKKYGNLSSRDDDWGQEQRGRSGAQEHHDPGIELTNGHANQQIRDAPDHGHHQKEGPTTS